MIIKVLGSSHDQVIIFTVTFVCIYKFMVLKEVVLLRTIARFSIILSLDISYLLLRTIDTF